MRLGARGRADDVAGDGAGECDLSRVWSYGGLKSTLNGGLTFVNQSLQAPKVTRGMPVGISP